MYIEYYTYDNDLLYIDLKTRIIKSKIDNRKRFFIHIWHLKSYACCLPDES